MLLFYVGDNRRICSSCSQLGFHCLSLTLTNTDFAAVSRDKIASPHCSVSMDYRQNANETMENVTFARFQLDLIQANKFEGFRFYVNFFVVFAANLP